LVMTSREHDEQPVLDDEQRILENTGLVVE
jgi:hypothetical protein